MQKLGPRCTLWVVCALWALVFPWPGAAVDAAAPAKLPPTARQDGISIFLPALVVPPQPQATAVATGAYHTCALTSRGGVQCWGDNSTGQLGDGSGGNWDDQHVTPVAVVGLGSGVAALATGAQHTCALTSGGGVQCWGDNSHGQLGDGSGGGVGAQHLTPVDVVGLSRGVTALAAGGWHTCALTEETGVKCWGANGYGQLGDGTQVDRLTPVDVVAVSPGATALAASWSQTCAVTQAGGIQCWGDNAYGQLGDGGGGVPCGAADAGRCRLMPVDVVGLRSRVTTLAVGGLHTCALTGGGDVQCWGRNSEGQLGDGGGGVPCGAQVGDICRFRPVDVVGVGRRVTTLAAGDSHTCALTGEDGMQCWGYNGTGQLGDGTTGDGYLVRLTPVATVGLSRGVTAIAAGHAHTCALTDAGGVQCWGFNWKGQLGDGTTETRLTPVDVVWP